MKESPFYQEILAEGRKEGRLEARREDTLTILASRFGRKATKGIALVLACVEDEDRLSRIFGAAAKCRRFVEFRRQLVDKKSLQSG